MSSPFPKWYILLRYLVPFFSVASPKTVLWAQDNPVVSLSIVEGKVIDINGYVPYDQYFDVKIPRVLGLKEVSFNYRIIPSERKNWHYFPHASQIIDTSDLTIQGFLQGSIPGVLIGEEFIIRNVGPLHPRVRYEFQVTGNFGLRLDLVKRDKLSKIIAQNTEELISEDITVDKIEYRLEIINQAIKEAFWGEEIPPGFNPQEELVDFRSEGINKLVESLLKVQEELTNNQDALSLQIEGFIDIISEDTTGLAKKFLTLSRIYHQGSKGPDGEVLAFDPLTKYLFEKEVFPHLEPYESLQLSEICLFFSYLFIRPELIKSILTGDALIRRTQIDLAASLDSVSLKFLLGSFQLFSSSFFYDEEQKPLFSQSQDTLLSYLYQDEEFGLMGILRVINQIGRLQMKKDRLIQEYRFNQVVYTESRLFRIPIVSGLTLESGKSPLVELDLGYGHAPFIGNNILYEGANIYLVPVNKRGGLGWSDYKKRRHLKYFSFTLGIAQQLGQNNYKLYRPLLGDVGSPLVGVGINFGPFKFSLGSLIYQKKDINPIVDNASTVLTPLLSISLDPGLSNSFGSLSTVAREKYKNPQ